MNTSLTEKMHLRASEVLFRTHHSWLDKEDSSLGSSSSKPHYRAVFISDLHIGTPGCQAKALLEFLSSHTSTYLYLVGDIVDGWQLRKRWYWPQTHNDVVQKILRKARKGCKVIYVPGNHDEFARGFINQHFGGVMVVEEAVHKCANGEKFWITHGDYFDGVIQYAKWLAYLGDNLYEFSLKLNRYINNMRARMGLSYWSLSAFLKQKVKKAVNYVSDFEMAVIKEAKKRGYQGVVCGRIHRAEIRKFDKLTYTNCGDWVESMSALVEHHDGRLEIIYTHAQPNQTLASATAQAESEKPSEVDEPMHPLAAFAFQKRGELI